MKLNQALQNQRPPNLTLSDQILNLDACTTVAEFIMQNRNFINIELRGCNINAKGFEIICKALPLETKSLLAEWNAIGSGINALCDLLSNPACQIQLIDLKNNRIQPEGCARFGQVLKTNQILQSVNLKWNEIGEKGAQYLWEALHYNQTLKFLDISCNKVPEGLITQIRQKIETNRSAELVQKNQQNIVQSQRSENIQTQTLPRVQQAAALAPTPATENERATMKNEQIRVQQLKENIDQELRANRMTSEELSRRMDQLNSDLMVKEQAVIISKRRQEELLNQKAVIESEFAQIRIAFDRLSESGDYKQQQTMNEYIVKNKHVLSLENDYLRELNSIRQDNKAQIDQVHQHWSPYLSQAELKHNGYLKGNDHLNEELLHFKEMFLKMRLDHDENIQYLEQRRILEERNKYTHQLEVMRRKELEIEQEWKSEQARSQTLQDDLLRLETQIGRDKQLIEQQIQSERDSIHQTHLQMSKRSIRVEKYISQNIVMDSHIDKLQCKIRETNYILNTLKDNSAEDLQQRRFLQEQQYAIHKQNQSLAHQRVLDLEMLLRNQESANQRLKSEYEKLFMQLWEKYADRSSNQAHDYLLMSTQDDPSAFLHDLYTQPAGLIFYGLLVLVVLMGALVRRSYSKREQILEKLPFDFETAARDMTLDHLFTDQLMQNNNFQLVDLMYHAHRIVLKGNNTYDYPWTLPVSPPEDITYLVDPYEFRKFAAKVNKLCEWKIQRQVLLWVLQIMYYPLYWWVYVKAKKQKYRALKKFITQNEIKFWKEMDQIIRVKLSKSADYTLIYIDIFNYKMSDLKYFILSCPYMILLSGEGTFLRPLYLCESNPFLTCLYFAINRKNQLDEERNKILDNLVGHKKRMENSLRLNRFIIKFNRLARAINLDSMSIVYQVRALVSYCHRINKKFFEKLTIRINLVLLMEDEITVLENQDTPEFAKYISERQKANFRFGLFIFDTELEIEDLEDVIDNQKISFYEYHPKPEEEEEFDINGLKEQFIEREEQSNLESEHIPSFVEEDQDLEKRITCRRKLASIGPMFMSHCINDGSKNLFIIYQIVLTLIDGLLLPILMVNDFRDMDTSDSLIIFKEIQVYLLPFPGSIPVSQLLGLFWITTQSYGIAKTHLIFTVLSVFNLTIYIAVGMAEMSWIFKLVWCLDLFTKLLLVYTTKRVLSLNMKLNKINQLKHIIQ